MVIITADDYGKTRHATDSILTCHAGRHITSASAMVFMEDSERAAVLALKAGLEVGLHLNYTVPFNSGSIPSKLRDHHNRVISYLNAYKLSQILFNPFLRNSFHYLFSTQQDEFVRIYGKKPEFFNGHHHMHLCANVLLAGMIPTGERVRRTFTFNSGEKNLLNRLYRRMLDSIIAKRYISSDSFFSMTPIQDKRLQNIFSRGAKDIVEIEVHPENREEMDFLFSERYSIFTGSVRIGSFKEADKTKKKGEWLNKCS